MTREQGQVQSWMQTAGQATPTKPTMPDLATRKLRARLILEEALETIEALGFEVVTGEGVTIRGQQLTYDNLRAYDSQLGTNLTDIADGCEDLKVVTEGCLIACGLVDKSLNDTGYDRSHGGGNYRVNDGKDPLFDDVMLSNWSKFMRQPTGEYVVFKDTNGKIQKSPDYRPPNLDRVIAKWLESTET